MRSGWIVVLIILMREICDEYLIRLQKQIWTERYNETIELEKQMGIFKDLKRKKKRSKNGTDASEVELEKLENKKK